MRELWNLNPGTISHKPQIIDDVAFPSKEHIDSLGIFSCSSFSLRLSVTLSLPCFSGSGANLMPTLSEFGQVKICLVTFGFGTYQIQHSHFLPPFVKITRLLSAAANSKI